MSNRHRFTADGIPHYPDVEEAIKSSGIELSEIVFFELELDTVVSADPPFTEAAFWDRRKTTIGKHLATLFVILKNGSEQRIGELTGPIRYV